MPRAPRIEFNNAWYHVMNRGAGRKNIFPNRELRYEFLDLLGEAACEYKLEIHAYCLMDNHFHLLIKTPYPNLNLAMQRLLAFYVRKHNAVMKTDGPLFKSRYKAILIAEEQYLAQVGRYVHRNPVEAKLSKSAAGYPFSSMGYYLNSNGKPSWLYLEKMIQLVSPRRDNADYVKFIENSQLPSLTEFYAQTRLPSIFGSNYTRQLIASRSGYSRKWSPLNRQSIDEIVDAIANHQKVSRDSIMKTIRGRRNFARTMAMEEAQRSGKYTAREIGEYFGVSVSTVNDTIARYRSQKNNR